MTGGDASATETGLVLAPDVRRRTGSVRQRCLSCALLVCLAVAAGSVRATPAVRWQGAAHDRERELPPPAWGPTVDGLRIGLVLAADPGRQGLDIVLQNVGDADFVLRLGSMLANGKVMWPTAITLFLTAPTGATCERVFVDRRYPGVAGRLDDYIVAMRPASSYSFRVTLSDYPKPGATRFDMTLPRGRYILRARFDGKGAQHLNSDTPGVKLLNFWRGQVESAPATFEVP
ncbi:MAG: hypothetical protein AB7O67_05455 [Vicinamibacterales bacterium]